nr:phospholipase-like protein [Tanacetum cinerariifolium]
MAEKDGPLNTLNDQDMNLFLKYVMPWGEHVELWVNYMWHFRPHNADWAMVGAYFIQLLLQDLIPSWYANGSLYKDSWCDVEEPGTDDRGCGYFMWMDDFNNRISSSWPSTPPTLYTRPPTCLSYSMGTSRYAMNVEKAECSNRIRLRRSKIIRLGSQPDNPLVDHGRELLKRLTGADMRNTMQMMGARHELQRSMTEKAVIPIASHLKLATFLDLLKDTPSLG